MVGHAYVQHFDKKAISKHEYRCIVGNEKSRTDWQGKLAKELCAHTGIRVEEYNNDSKTFGMEEVKLSAQLIAPKYGIVVHNSLTANSIVFETLTSEDHKIVSWINLLNLNDILIPSQSRRDSLEHVIGANSATNAMRINRNTSVFQTASRAKL